MKTATHTQLKLDRRNVSERMRGQRQKLYECQLAKAEGNRSAFDQPFCVRKRHFVYSTGILPGYGIRVIS